MYTVKMAKYSSHLIFFNSRNQGLVSQKKKLKSLEFCATSREIRTRILGILLSLESAGHYSRGSPHLSGMCQDAETCENIAF